MTKAFLIVLFLDSVVFYETIDQCWEVSKRLNSVENRRISTCVPTHRFKNDLDKMVDKIVFP